jgi:SAM-dependent methyltransferase
MNPQPPRWRRVLSRLGRAIGFQARRAAPSAPPLAGYSEHRQEIPFVDPLSDEDLTELNNLLRWHSFTVDRHGRRFGGVAWAGKRDRPQAIPDPRIVLMNERFDLSDKHVLEFGCFEGIHTIGLARFARRVTAVDGRVENVAKTIVRAAMYGCSPTVFKYDVEKAPVDADLLRSDVLHHVGVLYHLTDPVRHLLELGRYIRLGVMLDTHYAGEGDALESYEVDGRWFRYKLYRELGHQDVFSGLYAHSKWLPLDAIVGLLRETGFRDVEVVETRQERNGLRVLLFAERGA